MTESPTDALRQVPCAALCDSARGNPTPAQVEAFLGPEWIEEIDWKNEAEAQRAYELYVLPRLKAWAR